MKTVYLFFVALFAILGASGHGRQTYADSVEICGRKYQLPENTRLTGKQELTAPTFTMSWQYVTEKKQEKLMANTLNDISGRPGYSQIPLDCFFMGTPCKAYGLSGNGPGTILIATNVNQQPVFVQISLSKARFYNEALPSFISSLITLSR